MLKDTRANVQNERGKKENKEKQSISLYSNETQNDPITTAKK